VSGKGYAGCGRDGWRYDRGERRGRDVGAVVLGVGHVVILAESFGKGERGALGYLLELCNNGGSVEK